MPNEKQFASSVMKGLKGIKGGHPQRHEDAVSVGIADLSYGARGVSAWVELKSFDAWPKRESTLVSFRGLTPIQRVWLRRRGESAGHVFVLLRVEDVKEYLLFNWEQLSLLGESTQAQLKELALGMWQGRIDFPHLSDLLTQ